VVRVEWEAAEGARRALEAGAVASYLASTLWRGFYMRLWAGLCLGRDCRLWLGLTAGFYEYLQFLV